MTDTAIEWTRGPDGRKGKAWNPTTGCNDDIVSPGCERCYARRMANRLAGRYGYPGDEPFRVTLHPDRLDAPLHWRKPRRVFVDSMGDLFHEDVPDEFIAAVFGVMAACPQHTFMVLTKRAERMAEWFGNPLSLLDTTEEAAASAAERLADVIWDARGNDRWKYNGPPPENLAKRRPWPGWPLPNVYLGVTAEDQQRADERIPLLFQTPAAVRFVSVEPMLGPVDIEYPETLYPDGPQYCCPGHECGCMGKPIDPPLRWGPYDSGLDWAICGAETGPGARPMNPAWARSLRDQCRAAGVPFFFKKPSPGQQTPSDLAIREWPEMTR